MFHYIELMNIKSSNCFSLYILINIMIFYHNIWLLYYSGEKMLCIYILYIIKSFLNISHRK